ncbi:hypothetical protein [Reyranella sp.]|uniref:hypothetical protein n=1 Tax=Reyranella sp. TaxID=1929291 RepID=UPI003BAD28F8
MKALFFTITCAIGITLAGCGGSAKSNSGNATGGVGVNGNVTASPTVTLPASK